ncbi:MAG: hypothetical protein ACE5DO_04070 [Desulfobacterales bacterium]
MRLEDHPTVKKYRGKKKGSSDLPGTEKLDSDWLKSLVLNAGAADIGLIGIDHPGIADQRQEILEIFPRTKSIISMMCCLNRDNIRSVSQAIRDLEFLQTIEKVDSVARAVVASLNERGLRAMNPSSGFPMDMEKWPGKMWSISHKPVAVAAGLGVMGLNRLLLHPRYGSFNVLGTILFDREVSTYDGPLEFNPCVDCKLCASVCPVGAVGADGSFNFTTCMTHNYRDRLGGFQDWVERVVSSKDVKSYRKKVSDSETVSIWQSLSYGICNKSSYCMAVCPAGEYVIGPFLDDRKKFIEEVVKPLQQKKESIYVVQGSDGEAHVLRRFPHKTVKRIGNGLRPNSATSFLQSLPIVFQPHQSEGIDSTYHFSFTGDEDCSGTVVIRKMSIEVKEGLVGTPDLHVTADSRTWIDFLAKEKNLLFALLGRKIRLKGPPRLMKAFARCFPS